MRSTLESGTITTLLPTGHEEQPVGHGLSAGRALPAATGQLVLRHGSDLDTVRTLGRELVDRAADLPHRPGNRDAEDTLTTLQEVDDLFRRGALVDGRAVGEQRDLRQVLHAAAPQVVDRDP